MAKKNLNKKTSSSKLDSADKKAKKLSSRKALTKFANSELKPEKKNKSNSIKKKNSKPFDIKNQPKPVMVASSDVRSKFANTDAVSWRKMKDDALVENSAIQSQSTQSKRSTKLFSQTSSNLLSNASILLAIATGIAILFAFVMVLLPGGRDAVPAMGGVLEANTPLKTAQIVFFLDILFPITFGAGFALLATAFQTRGNRPIVRMVLTGILFAVLADFSENALVFKALTGGDTYAVQWPLTVIKYAMLALSAVLLSSIMVVSGILGTMAILFLRFFFPISIAVLVAGIGGRMGGDIVGATFPLGLMLLAIYAKTLNSL